MDWQIIESDEALQQKLLQVASSDVVIVDTEFMRRNTFYPQVALVQLCFVNDSTGHETAWLIDPLCIQDTAPLVALLTDPNVLKVMHSASEDLEVFHHWLGVVPQPLFDTQRAAALLDRGFGLGYRALVQEICDIDLPKGETQSNWLQRPLTVSQCEYAGLDVTWLLRVWQDLYAQCVEEEKLDWVLSDGVDAMNGLASAKMESHKRIKTAFKLNSRELGALVAICEWREETARRRDKPRSWIIEDKTCLQLAQRDPRSLTELQADLELPAPVLRRHSAELLELLARQRDVPVAELPLRLPAPLDAGQRNQLKKLKAEARTVAEQLGIAPEVLLQSKDYELLLREAGGESVDFPPSWLGWRNASVLAPLRQYLAGRG
jgi:ribonuclease D